MRAEDDGVVVEFVERADADKAVERDDGVNAVNVDALDDREGGFALVFEHAHALGKRSDAEHTGDLGHGFDERLGLVDQGAGANLHIALSVDDHAADFVTETAHDAVGHDEGGHAQRHAEDRNRREKRQPLPAREELFEGEVEVPGHRGERTYLSRYSLS